MRPSGSCPLASFANLPVSLWIYPDRIVVVAEGAIICEHQRIIERSHHGKGQHDEQAVLVAVEMTLQAGVASKTHILNLLHRLTNGTAS
jgi:hypothetical protein